MKIRNKIKQNHTEALEGNQASEDTRDWDPREKENT